MIYLPSEEKPYEQMEEYSVFDVEIGEVIGLKIGFRSHIAQFYILCIDGFSGQAFQSIRVIVSLYMKF